MRTQTQTKVWFAKEEKGERTNMLSYLYFGVPEVCRQIKANFISEYIGIREW